MLYTIDISNNRVLLTHEQVDALDALLSGAPRIFQEFAGTGQGDNGSAYRTLVDSFMFEEHVTLKTMSSDRCAALQLAAKLAKESK